MIRCQRHHLEQRAVERGYPFESVVDCIVATHPDGSIDVDETHPAYPRPGIGDAVAAGLAAVGITPERITKATGKPCGCGKRKRALNRLGRRLGVN